MSVEAKRLDVEMPLGTQVGLGPRKKGHSLPIYGPCLLCQTAGWIKMPLDAEVGFGRGHIVLDGNAAPHRKGHSSPPLYGHVYCGQTVAHLSYC